MKTFTVTLTKPGHTASCEIHYKDASWPVETIWKGDRAAFLLSDGTPVTLLSSMDRLYETVAHQANQAEARRTIEDHGGDAPMRTDEVKG